MLVDLWTYRANLVRVVDGDSLIMRIDEGFYNETVQRLRLLGVHAPELFSGTNREMGATAKADCLGWFMQDDRVLPEWGFLVRTEKDRQTFGRFIATVYDLEGQSLNEYLISRPWQEATA